MRQLSEPDPNAAAPVEREGWRYIETISPGRALAFFGLTLATGEVREPPISEVQIVRDQVRVYAVRRKAAK